MIVATAQKQNGYRLSQIPTREIAHEKSQIIYICMHNHYNSRKHSRINIRIGNNRKAGRQRLPLKRALTAAAPDGLANFL